MEEEWRAIAGYEGYYEVSNLGRVKSLKRQGKEKDTIRKPVLTAYGYLEISLSLNSVHKIYKVHRLVAFAFIENPDNKDLVNHIDGIRHHDAVDNLEWCTSSENQLHRYSVLVPIYGKKSLYKSPPRKHKLSTYARPYPSKRVPLLSTPVSCFDKSGQKMDTFKTIKEASDYFKITVIYIHGAIYRNSISAGFFWKYDI